MIEILVTLSVFVLAAGGMGIGLMFGRGPAQTSCGAISGRPEGRCAHCPLRRQQQDGERQCQKS